MKEANIIVRSAEITFLCKTCGDSTEQSFDAEFGNHDEADFSEWLARQTDAWKNSHIGKRHIPTVDFTTELFADLYGTEVMRILMGLPEDATKEQVNAAVENRLRHKGYQKAADGTWFQF